MSDGTDGTPRIVSSDAPAAADAILLSGQLVTKEDGARLEIQIFATHATVWKAVIAGSGLVVVLNKVLDWVIQ